jgi:parallel beta-helix repeat protein
VEKVLVDEVVFVPAGTDTALPERVQVALGELAGAAKEGLLALAVGVGLRGCRIHDGQRSGVWVHERGAGTIEDCDISDNARAGVHVETGGSPAVRRCRINRNGYEAIWVTEQGRAVVEDCDLTANKRGAWDIARAANRNVSAKGNRER